MTATASFQHSLHLLGAVSREAGVSHKGQFRDLDSHMRRRPECVIESRRTFSRRARLKGQATVPKDLGNEWWHYLLHHYWWQVNLAKASFPRIRCSKDKAVDLGTRCVCFS